MKTKKAGLKVLAISLAIVFSVLGSSMVAAEEYVEPDIETPTSEEMREDALNRLEDATEEIEDVRLEAEELKITVPAAQKALDAITSAEARLARAKTAFAEGNYGLSFIYAGKAESLAENADALLDKIEESYEKDWEIEVEIEYRRAYVELELDELEMEFVLDTPNKEEIIREIMARTGLCQSIVRMITVFEFDDEIFEEIEELASELGEALYEQGEVYLEILEEIRETMLAIEEDLQEFKGLKMDLIMLDIDPWIRDILIGKLTDIWSSIEEITLLVREGRVVEAHGETDKIILSLGTFITAVEIYLRDDNREILLERAEEIVENARDWKETLKDLIAELREILMEFDEALREVQSITSELEALGAELEVTVEQREKPMVTSAWITTTITAGGVTVKEVSSCVTALKLEKPVIASLMGKFKHEILKTFEVKTTLPHLDKRLFPLIFPHTLGMLVLIEGENPDALLTPAIVGGGIRGEVTDRTIAQFLAFVTVERNVFRPIHDRFFPVLGVGLVFRPRAEYQKITHAPGMDTWRWWDGDFGWTHRIDGYPFVHPVVTVTPPRLTIRANDVNWADHVWRRRGLAHWQHDRVYADGHYIGTLTGLSRQWALSKFDSIRCPRTGEEIDTFCYLLEDGRVDIQVNIDSKHTRRTWVVKIDWSKLEWGLVVEIRPMVGEVPDEETLERIREWLRQQGIGREDIGELPEIWVWRTVSRIKDGEDFFVKEYIVSGVRFNRVRIKGIDTPEVRTAMPEWWPRRCENQYHHAAAAKKALEGKIPRGTIVRIVSYYPFGACKLLGIPWRIQGFVFRHEDGLDIAYEMISKGYGVAAFGMWDQEPGEPRRRELQNAQQAAKEAISPRGIWHGRNPVNVNPERLRENPGAYRLLLHPHYYRRWVKFRFYLGAAVRRSQIKLSHAK